MWFQESYSKSCTFVKQKVRSNDCGFYAIGSATYKMNPGRQARGHEASFGKLLLTTVLIIILLYMC